MVNGPLEVDARKDTIRRLEWVLRRAAMNNSLSNCDRYMYVFSAADPHSTIGEAIGHTTSQDIMYH